MAIVSIRGKKVANKNYVCVKKGDQINGQRRM